MMPGALRTLCAIAVFLASFAVFHPGEAATPGDVLSAADVERYNKIFVLQEQSRWKEADGLIAALEDDVLLGHALWQRYMHPTGWRSKFGELQAWLAEYSDQPDAEVIHKLARKRGKGRLESPSGQYLKGSGGAVGGGAAWSLSDSYKGGQFNAARRVWARFRSALRKGATLTVKRIVQSEETRRALTPLDHRKMQAALAHAYFVDGRDDWALQWARRASAGTGDLVPTALWAGGLASWRLGSVEASGDWFERLANAPDTSEWLTSAGAYWAARAALRNREPEKVSSYLAKAAEHPRTFYGLIARRALGLPLRFKWENEGLTRYEARVLSDVPGGRRALALVQIGRFDLAEKEVRKLWPEAADDARNALVRLADIGGMSSLALHMAALLNGGDATDDRYASAEYPIPLWEPEGGWQLDRALVYAFVRQESGFNPAARSWAGARGLMQMMPATARYVAGGNRSDLHEPEVNLALGQKYLRELLGMGDIDGNLFFAAAAYNGGPGNLGKWRRKVKFDDDPLLFIEGVPSRETRIYIERVVSNLWIYRNRMGQPTPSLDDVAAGEWPRYVPIDDAALAMAAAVR